MRISASGIRSSYVIWRVIYLIRFLLFDSRGSVSFYQHGPSGSYHSDSPIDTYSPYHVPRR